MGKFLRKIKSSEFGMRVFEKCYPRFDSSVYSSRHLLANAMKRFDKCDDKKSQSQINAEISLCKKFWKCYPYDYFLCDLYRKENQMSPEEIIDYIPGFFWYYLYLPHHTSYKYSMISDNKIISEHFFHDLNIEQPETLCRIINGTVYSPQMQRWTYDTICNEIKQKHYEKLFFKPAEGGRSSGILIFQKKSDGTYSTRDNVHFTRVFLSSVNKSREFILQPGIFQDHRISKIYPDSVNTCRMVTENNGGRSRVVCAVLRMGRNQNEVDNAAVGGIFSKIDIKSGKVESQAFSYDCEKFSRHPDTNFEFNNLQIPRWEEIVNFTKESADKLPFFTHLGWDIALTTKGPIAIEVNLGLGLEILQISHGGLRRVFGIDDPDFYWKNPGKRRQ
jgi:hypothetical protein